MAAAGANETMTDSMRPRANTPRTRGCLRVHAANRHRDEGPAVLSDDPSPAGPAGSSTASTKGEAPVARNRRASTQGAPA